MKVIKFKNNKIHSFFEYFNQRKIELLYCTIFLLGIFLGTFFSGKSLLNAFDVNVFFENFLNSRDDSRFVDVFLNTFSSGMVYLLFCYFSGMFALGGISNGLILLLKGTSLGVIMGYSYLVYGLKGVIFSVIIILPSAFITNVTLIYAAKESFIFSLCFFRLFTDNLLLKPIRTEFKRYCIKYIAFIFLILFSALVDGLLTKIFFNVINL